MIKLGIQQQEAFDRIMAWHKTDAQEFALAGYAGTGKTTLAKRIAQEFGNVIFCAYTGKAAQVLRDKGCGNAGTIHGYLYRLQGEEGKEPVFGLNEESAMRYADLVIVDEYSFLNAEIIQDLRTICDKILYLGDPFQLPPVNGQCIIEPDFFIDEIHRQALESPIIRYATMIRNGDMIRYCDEGEFRYLKNGSLSMDDFMKADQFIVGRNDTRIRFNRRARMIKGFEAVLPVKGDKMICLKNNPRNAVFNGMIDYAASDAEIIDYLCYGIDMKELGHLNVIRDNERHDFRQHRRLNMFDFAYAITCHKSQGSEFNDVIIYKEPIGRDITDRRKWLYTAVTRGKNRVTLTDPVR
ncbi:ATP-dependent RecD-like DNA helicase [Rufibacter sediminis]|uniref:AAA family ATPase n=1 Tax=Rufibacter sediminis TaxID=2762756 RepID=A0ABR6VU09_9BACT|nr:ATP-dependent RecD-like DNA helicase [Rufibacter sediminis]MBC3540641.1 AAA family ATPase [Rufibacter sediminis]